MSLNAIVKRKHAGICLHEQRKLFEDVFKTWSVFYVFFAFIITQDISLLPRDDYVVKVPGHAPALFSRSSALRYDVCERTSQQADVLPSAPVRM